MASWLILGAIAWAIGDVIRYFIQRKALPAVPYTHCPQCGTELPQLLTVPCTKCRWKRPQKPALPWSAFVLLFLCVIVFAFAAYMDFLPSSSYFAPTPVPIIFSATSNALTYIAPIETGFVSTQAAFTQEAYSGCIRWDYVTVRMDGQTECVYGLLKNLNRTRYEFSDAPNTFFLYSKYEIADPDNGKTLAPGSCVRVTATIHVQQNVPYINVDELLEGRRYGNNFQFSYSPSDCQ
jgi:predicted nucleic acid-binding Zn ribbon protein